MEQVDQGKFACNQCGKTYKWKPDFAGRKVKCKCGYVMTAPKAPPVEADAGPDLDALYDLAEDGKAAAAAAPAMIRCPSCTGEMEPGVQVCPSCGFNLKTGKKARAGGGGGGGGGAKGPSVAAIPSGAGGAAAAAAAPGNPMGAYAAFGKPRKGLQKDSEPSGVAIEWYIPIGLIAVGIVLTLLQAMKFNRVVFAFPDALMFAGAKLVISLVLLTIACYLCVKWAEFSFGSPGPAALKIAGMALAPAALAQIVSFLIHDVWLLVGFFLAFGIYFTLCHYLFEFDMTEKWVVAFLGCAICFLATPVIATMVLSGGSMGKFSVADKAVKNEDAAIDYLLELGRPKPAREWIDESSNRIVGDLPRGTSVELIDELYALKPKGNKVWIVPEGPQAAEILLELPGDDAKRKAFFDWAAGPGQKYKGRTSTTDRGEKWFVVGFMPVDHPEPIGF